ncbi:MAG: TrkH family potassium uptake protein [Parabacteroides sp.]
MHLRNLYFSWWITWEKAKRSLGGFAEAIILLSALASLFTLVYRFGFEHTPESFQLIAQSRTGLLLAFFTGITLRYLTRFQEILQERMFYTDISIYTFLLTVLSATVFFPTVIAESLPYLSFFGESFCAYLLLLLLSIIHLSRQLFSLIESHVKPSLLFLFSFVFVILIGTGLLMLPNATTAGITFVDALFMATTSVCVTGLATMDVATAFTSVGQTVILVLVQIGGIGVMTFTAFIALSFMGKSSFSSKMVLKDMLNEVKTGGLFQVIFNILFVTFFIEGIGAYLIFQSVKGTLPGGATEEFFYALFHAVIGFCNAGMSTLSGNMADPLIVHNNALHLSVIFLIIMGGIGFPIVFNFLSLLRHQLANGLRLLFRQQKHYIHTPHIINLHTYVVVTATLLLLIGGFSLYLLFEYHNSLQGLPWDEKLTQALFGAATPRSAGFNATDVCALASPTLILTLALMLIGAGPVSTGSGLKVTTVTIALLAIVHILTGRKELTIHGRTISSELILRAFATIMLTLAWLLLVFMLLSFTEQGIPLFNLLFEATSALSTAGLSMDVTPHLSTIGKVIIIFTMLIGRIGVLTFFICFSPQIKEKHYQYPQEHLFM